MDGLERELAGQALVVRLSVFSKLGQEMITRHDVRGIPTFLIFDAQGNLIGRHTGFPKRGRIKDLVARGA